MASSQLLYWSVMFCKNIKILPQGANFATQLEIPPPTENCGVLTLLIYRLKVQDTRQLDLQFA